MRLTLRPAERVRGASRSAPTGCCRHEGFSRLRRGLSSRGGSSALKRPACTGPIAIATSGDLELDLTNLKASMAGVRPKTLCERRVARGRSPSWQTSISLAGGLLAAIADAMGPNTSDLSCALPAPARLPDLAMNRHIQFADLKTSEFRKQAAMQIEALNHALANIPAEAARLHLCWGNYEGPHHRDVPLKDIIDIVLKASARVFV